MNTFLKDSSLLKMHEFAKRIFGAALLAVNPYNRIKEIVKIEKNNLIIQEKGKSEKVLNLEGYRRIFIFGAGKASSLMAKAIEEIFGEKITSGLIITKYGHSIPLRYIKIIEAGHPLPDFNGYEGSKKIKEILKQTGTEDLIIFLVSGGGSSLFSLPCEGISIEEKRLLTKLLLDCGADIKEINTVRKHISEIKGGWFAKWAYPSTILTFILSDVVGDSLDIVASGPTVPDPSTFGEAFDLLKRYDLIDKVPQSIKNHILLGMEGKVRETPKPNEKIFERVFNIIIGSNILALNAAKSEALSLGFNSIIISSSIVGDTKEVARFHIAIAREIISTQNPIAKPACILSGGETTVVIKGKGKGGRNQEFALTCALEIDGMEKVVILSGGTDGTDGPTDAAGAIADYKTMERARHMGLNPFLYLSNNDSYHFFERLGDLLITGPTNTNVMDVRIMLVN